MVGPHWSTIAAATCEAAIQIHSSIAVAGLKKEMNDSWKPYPNRALAQMAAAGLYDPQTQLGGEGKIKMNDAPKPRIAYDIVYSHDPRLASDLYDSNPASAHGTHDIVHSQTVNDPGCEHKKISEEEARIVRLAHILCEAAGFDPNKIVIADRVPQIGPKGRVVVTKTCMGWELFIGEATASIRFFEGNDK
jgi:hypothetical protein